MNKRVVCISFLITVTLLFTISYFAVKGFVNKGQRALNHNLKNLTVNKLDTGAIDILKENAEPKFINLWATWCKPCTEELPDITTSVTKENLRKVYFLSNEEKSKILNFLDKTGNTNRQQFFQCTIADSVIDFSVLPKSLVLNEDNKIVWQKTGKLNGEDLTQINKLLKKFGK